MVLDAFAMVFLIAGVVGFWTALVSFWSDGLKLGLSRSLCLLILLVSSVVVFVSAERFFRP